MYIPSTQSILTSGLSLLGTFTTTSSVSKGSCLDYAVEKCLDKEGNVRCSKPFAVKKDSCYQIEWSTDGTFSHTTAEVRDAGSGEMVFYRDTDGEWKPEKSELVYIDFKPKIVGQANKTIEYEVKTCE